MSNITVTHSDSGLVRAEVLRSEQVSPHIVRVTFGGGDLAGFEYKGFDQWFRMAIPVRSGDRLDNLPRRFGFAGALRYLTLPKGTRPVIRNYTIRSFRRNPAEMDVDFVVHGTEGVAGPWAQNARPGAQIGFIDQGCGWNPVPADEYAIVADESGMPAALGVLRDMPRQSRGHAIIELFDEADRQEHEAPAGVDVHWVVRAPDEAAGTAALARLRELELGPSVCGFVVGESSLAKGGRRHLVNERGVPKASVIFCGYWKKGTASPS